MSGQRHGQPTPTSLGQGCKHVQVNLLLRATAVTRGWNRHLIESVHKFNFGDEYSPAGPATIRTRNLSIMSPALYQQAIPVPVF